MLPTAKDVQIVRIQQIIRETVLNAVCKPSFDGINVVCSSEGVEIGFDPTEPTYADLGRHARRLQSKVMEAAADALARRARGLL